MRSHPYTAAQRMSPMEVFDSILTRGIPSADPSFEPWREHEEPWINRVMIRDARITHFLDLPLTRDQLAEWERPVTHTRQPAPTEPCRWNIKQAADGSYTVRP